MATSAATLKPITVAGVLSLGHVFVAVWRVEVVPGVTVNLVVPMGKS